VPKLDLIQIKTRYCRGIEVDNGECIKTRSFFPNLIP
jgi:hypothetical protein